MRALVAIVISIVIVQGSPASGSVDVKPGRRDPSVALDATRVESRPSAQRPDLSSVADPTDLPVLPPDYSAKCRVDKIVGLYGCPNRVNPTARPDLTEGDIRRAVERIGLPRLEVHVQPANTTLVNVATIFSTSPQKFDRSVVLLGYNIDLVAKPQRFHWHYGDGSASNSERPGRPYPSMDITHAYRSPGDGLRPRVDVDYRVTYRVDGGSWRSLSDTITAAGPASSIDVKEAVPVLAKR